MRARGLHGDTTLLRGAADLGDGRATRRVGQDHLVDVESLVGQDLQHGFAPVHGQEAVLRRRRLLVTHRASLPSRRGRADGGIRARILSGSRHGRPFVRAGCLLPLPGGTVRAHARRECGDPAAAAVGFRLRAPARPGVAPPVVPASLPSVRGIGPGAPRAAGVGGGQRLRRQLPRATLGAPGPGLRRAAVRTGGQAAGAAARPRPPAVGAVRRRGVGERPGRAGDEEPPGAGRRHRHPRSGSADPGRRTQRARHGRRGHAAVDGVDAVVPPRPGAAADRRDHRQPPQAGRDRRQRAQRRARPDHHGRAGARHGGRCRHDGAFPRASGAAEPAERAGQWWPGVRGCVGGPRRPA